MPSSLDLLAAGLSGWGSSWSTWIHDGRGVTGDDQNAGGDVLWTALRTGPAFTYTAEVVIHRGALGQLHFLIDPAARRWYTLDLHAERGIATLSFADNGKGGGGLQPACTLPLAIERGRPYALRVEVAGRAIRGFVDDALVGTIEAARIESGPVGFGLFNARCEFRSPQIRLA